jgi:hypothetical protein
VVHITIKKVNVIQCAVSSPNGNKEQIIKLLVLAINQYLGQKGGGNRKMKKTG